MPQTGYVRRTRHGKWHPRNHKSQKPVTMCGLSAEAPVEEAESSPDDGRGVCCDCKRYVLAVYGNFAMLARKQARRARGD